MVHALLGQKLTTAAVSHPSLLARVSQKNPGIVRKPATAIRAPRVETHTRPRQIRRLQRPQAPTRLRRYESPKMHNEATSKFTPEIVEPGLRGSRLGSRTQGFGAPEPKSYGPTVHKIASAASLHGKMKPPTRVHRLWSTEHATSITPSNTHLGLARTDEANLEHPNAMTDYSNRTESLRPMTETTAFWGIFGQAIVQVSGSSVPDPYQSEAWPSSLDRQPCLQDGPLADY